MAKFEKQEKYLVLKWTEIDLALIARKGELR